MAVPQRVKADMKIHRYDITFVDGAAETDGYALENDTRYHTDVGRLYHMQTPCVYPQPLSLAADLTSEFLLWPFCQ